MTTIHHSPPPGAPPFAIFEDAEDLEPPSPSEAYDGDTSFNSEYSLHAPDEPLPSVELDQVETEPEPYNTTYTSRPSILSTSQSRRTSLISSLPSEFSIPSKPIPPTSHGADNLYTPRKERPPFRNPSSVRAMQMSSPPPFNTFENTRGLKGTYKLATPTASARSNTPVSATGSRRSGSQREVQQSPRPTPTPQQHFPLVLLHVTILPMQFPYPQEVMAKVMPTWLLDNYKLLEDKLKDIVMMRRGLLVPHPKDEYDILEERILESLDLKLPVLLRCGHFVPPGEESESGEEEDAASVTDASTGRGSRMSGETISVEEDADDESLCTDCHRQVKKPGKGIGKGKRKWDIKIYAANGLMRAGAWSAAWSDMERCDVDISPWIPDDMRKALDKYIEEEEAEAMRKRAHEAEVQRLVDEETTRLKRIEEEAQKRREEEAELRKAFEEEVAREQRAEEEAEEKKRVEDAWHEKLEEAKETIRLEIEAQSLAEANSVAERFRALEEELKKERASVPTPPPASDQAAFSDPPRTQSRGRPRSTSRRPSLEEIPLGTLLRNYLVLLARDQKNIAILLLSAFVVFLAMQLTPGASLHLQPSDLPSGLPDDLLHPISSVVVVTSTVTATTTAISVSVSPSVVTQIEPYAESVIEQATTSLPAPTPSEIELEHVSEVAMSSRALSLETPVAVLDKGSPDSSTTSILPESSTLEETENLLTLSTSAEPTQNLVQPVAVEDRPSDSTSVPMAI
ncbi:hypothetical protein EJ04DRAFT_511650 [Polyplosphaeria fusca]|uniref:Pathway-specific nitrogen regulator n=1 Tax=Polyplosphaeria fusca TaxID=682080 RepID=A0A9P4R293_9PLEO|nr:hypothetical protein EJ04DRAFT_511650 [Polyplosphaeria fusca]